MRGSGTRRRDTLRTPLEDELGWVGAWCGERRGEGGWITCIYFLCFLLRRREGGREGSGGDSGVRGQIKRERNAISQWWGGRESERCKCVSEGERENW